MKRAMGILCLAGGLAASAGAQTAPSELTTAQYQALSVDGRTEAALARAGRKLFAAGRYQQAEPVLEKRLWRALADGVQTPHEELGRALLELADLYAAQARYPEAEDLYDRAYAVVRPDLGLEDPLVLRVDDRRAELYRLQGRLLRSEEVGRRVLDARERTLGVDHAEVADSLDHLARLFRDEGRPAEAESLLKRALAIRGRGFGRWRSGYALTLRDLASVYAAQSRWTEAEQAYRRALTLERRTLGRRHPEAAATAAELAWVLKNDGQPTEAASLEQDAEKERQLSARDVPAD